VTERHERRRLTTRFLRIPPVDWPAVLCGEKRQVRQHVVMAPAMSNTLLPTPVVGYINGSRGLRDAQLLVVEAYRVEPLLAISQRDLEAEGFRGIDEYRRYWNAHRGGFKPLAKVAVYDVRPFAGDDAEEFGRSIFQHLYGPWLEAVSAS
jgi:hypothetical protein